MVALFGHMHMQDKRPNRTEFLLAQVPKLRGGKLKPAQRSRALQPSNAIYHEQTSHNLPGESMLRRNPAQKTCHFCNNIVSVAHNGDFQCPTCGSWNMFDAKGKLMSYHPAMHDEALNTHSFSKRGKYPVY
jgi:hypothetical protein